LSGFRYSAVEKTLWFGPQLQARPFKSFFSTASAFGTINLSRTSLRVNVMEGELKIEKAVLGREASAKTYDWKTTIAQGAAAELSLSS